MMKELIMAAVVALLAGCATKQSAVYVPQPVSVPVAVPCIASLPDEPAYPFDDVPLDAEIGVFVDALQADRLMRKAHILRLRALIVPCLAVRLE